MMLQHKERTLYSRIRYIRPPAYSVRLYKETEFYCVLKCKAEFLKCFFFNPLLKSFMCVPSHEDLEGDGFDVHQGQVQLTGKRAHPHQQNHRTLRHHDETYGSFAVVTATRKITKFKQIPFNTTHVLFLGASSTIIPFPPRIQFFILHSKVNCINPKTLKHGMCTSRYFQIFLEINKAKFPGCVLVKIVVLTKPNPSSPNPNRL